MSGFCLIDRWMAAFLAVPLFFVPGCGTPGGDAAGQKPKTQDIRVGGPCSYKSYDGTAHITRIVKTEASRKQAGVRGGPGYEGHEIWFRFAPKEKIALVGWQAGVFDREHLLTLKNGWYPGPGFIDKYRLAVGHKYPCTAQIIETGACTPIVFDFGTIDTCDYFESRR